jgi:hypothetical protein
MICNTCKQDKQIERFAKREYRGHWNYRKSCKDCTNVRTRKVWSKLRQEILDKYGRECKCCGESIEAFLALDHINDDGYLDKNPNGDKKSGKELYLLVKSQGFPDKYQILCHNCNWGKKVNKICPHKNH